MRIQAVLFTAFLLLGMVVPVTAEVESSVVKSVTLGAKPLDAATSPDGTRLFVLVEGGKVLVYSPGGKLQETIALEKPADGLELSKSGDILYLRSEERKTVDIVRLEFVQDITVGRSPVKGAANAPVTVAIFNDFQ